MPIYEYRCQDCGHELEKIQRMSDAPLTDCPECGAPQLRRLVSAAAFRLKGGGWYETDFKQDGKKNLHDSHAAKSEGGDKAGGDRASDKASSDKASSDKASSDKASSDKASDKSGAEKKESAKPAEVKKPSTDSAAAKPGAA